MKHILKPITKEQKLMKELKEKLNSGYLGKERFPDYLFDIFLTSDFHCYINIPGTVIIENGAIKAWVFTSKNGQVKKKKSKKYVN